MHLSDMRVGGCAYHVPGMGAFERHVRGRDGCIWATCAWAGVLTMWQAWVHLSDMRVGGRAYHVPGMGGCAYHVPGMGAFERHARGAKNSSNICTPFGGPVVVEFKASFKHSGPPEASRSRRCRRPGAWWRCRRIFVLRIEMPPDSPKNILVLFCRMSCKLKGPAL